MSIEPRFHHDAYAGPGDIAERRAQIEHQQQERAAERQQQIALQSSPLSDPEERIRLWEKLHELKLPRSATHSLLRVIAEQTNLSLQELMDVQQRRAGSVATPLAASL
jgi:hypothetical protein